MLISESHQIIFIHVQKTGGESISRVLKENLPDLRRFGPKHGYASQAAEILGPEWDRYFKIAFVRNPWDRLVSWYSMIESASRIGWLEALLDGRSRSHWKQARHNPVWTYVYRNAQSFREFVFNCTDTVWIPQGGQVCFTTNQLDYLTDHNGSLIVDFVGRFENFETDFGDLLSQLRLPQQRYHENNSHHRHYCDYYDAETQAIVQERYAKDLEFFGYSF